MPVRLVVLPEYFMQGVTTPGKGEDGIQQFLNKAVRMPGPEMDVLGDKAREYGIFIAGGGVVEVTPEFPDRWFNTAFVIDPAGEIALKYHKWHVPATIGLGSSPHDLYDDYGRAYGNSIKDLFPVIDTEIGKLGTMTCHDGCTPEVSRALGYNGAEVICHPGAIQEFEGVSRPWDFWMFTRRARAHDNMCYLLGSNWGQVNYAYYPKAFCPGNSDDHRLHRHGHAPGAVPGRAGHRGDDRHRVATRAPGRREPQHLDRLANRAISGDLRRPDLPRKPLPRWSATSQPGRKGSWGTCRNGCALRTRTVHSAGRARRCGHAGPPGIAGSPSARARHPAQGLKR